MINAFKRIEWKIAIKTGVAAALSLLAALWFSHILERPDKLVSGLWTVLSSIVVIQAYIEGTYKTAWTRFVGVLVGSVLGGMFVSVFGSTSAFSLGVSLFCTIILCSILNLKESFRIACLSVAVVSVLWGLSPEISPWTFAFFRFVDSCLGILIAIAVSHLLWPFQATKKMRCYIAKSLAALDHLFRLVAYPHLSEEKIKDVISQTEDLILQNRVFLEESKMELQTKADSLGIWTLFNDHLETTFKLIAALQTVNPSNFKTILDHNLEGCIADTIVQLDLYFQRLVLLIENKQPQEKTSLLPQSLEVLNKDIVRFKTTYTTATFNLEEVENLFVFLYHLNSIGQELQTMGQRIQSLNNADFE